MTLDARPQVRALRWQRGRERANVEAASMTTASQKRRLPPPERPFEVSPTNGRYAPNVVEGATRLLRQERPSRKQARTASISTQSGRYGFFGYRQLAPDAEPVPRAAACPFGTQSIVARDEQVAAEIDMHA
jgi:hypothetical protein